MRNTTLYLSFLCLGLSFLPTIGLSRQDPVIEELIETIQNSSLYDQAKLNRIDSLRTVLYTTDKDDLSKTYHLNQLLYNEYNVFKRDSAFTYGLQMKELAIRLDDHALIAHAIVNLSDISVSAGMYKEALDFLNTINTDEIPQNMGSLYYGLLGRCYSEMAEYSTLPHFSSRYNKLAASYRKSALALTDSGTFFNQFLRAFIEYNEGHAKNALGEFNRLSTKKLSLRESALVHYLLGDIYANLDQNEKAIFHYAQSALSDIKTSTKENLATIRLAELLFKEDDIKNASIFIQKAFEDARFYGAQQRKIRVGAILPLIEEKMIDQTEKQRQRLYRQNIITTVLLVFVIALAIIIFAQVTKLKAAKRIIVKAHQKLQKTNKRIVAANDKIESTNAQLRVVNNQLLEANKIKEEYVGFFFTQDVNIFEKFRSFKLKVQKDLENNNFEKAKHLVLNYNLKKEKLELLENFDEAFIKLFPNFIKEFNLLLKPEEQISVKKGRILNKELRIFALIRLGIHHNDIIAQILGYSVNSIYAYKTKIRKKSSVDTRNFDQKLLENTTLKL